MKLLQINCWYEAGSTGKIVQAIHKYMQSNGHQSYVLYGMGEKNSDSYALRTTPNMVRKLQSLRSRITGYPYGGCLWGTFEALRYIDKVNPDIVHIQCMNGYMVNVYKVLKYLKRRGIPTVITNHAEFMYTGGCTHAVDCQRWITGCHDCPKINREHPISYFFDRTRNEWLQMKAAYKGFDLRKLFICNVSDWVTERAKQSPFYKGYQMKTVFNGLDTGTFHCIRDSRLKQELGFQNEKIVVHMTPAFYSPIKGGQHVLEMAKRFPDVHFLIVGDAKGRANSENVHFVGRINDQKLLANYYSIADACLLTSLRETYSMVTAESLCCGTPVVGFKAGGPETIAIPQYSRFANQGEDNELEKKIREVLAKRWNKMEISEEACSNYSDEKMCESYFNIYHMMLNYNSKQL